MSARLLVTGGTGYLGAVLVRRLLERTMWGVTVLSRQALRRPWLDVLQHQYGARIRLVVGDIRSETHVDAAYRDCTAVIHLAGLVGFPACEREPSDAATINIEGARVVCRVVRRAGVDHAIVVASTASVYGQIPGIATEETPLRPLSRYACTKAEAERIALDHGASSLRFGTLFGPSPEMRWGLLVNDYCRRAVSERLIRLRDGAARRSFLHVEDAAAVLASAACDEGWRPGIYNAGHEALNHTKRDVASLILRHVGGAVVDEAGRDPDGRDYFVSCAKIASLWQPTISSIAAGLPDLIDLACSSWPGSA